MFPLDAIIVKNERIPWRIIEGEAILVKVDSGEVIHLNEVAAEIWRKIDGQRKISEIIDLIQKDFDVDREQAEKDTLELIKSLSDINLVAKKGK
ncbi:MAG: PqqD family protein [Candidatus Aminicenantes bacterium]|nr:MAG: PqqD family protein [Candidatus Aminicenantes bacterium]